MGAFSRTDTLTIPRTPEEGKKWGWDAHETVTLKGRMTVADIEAATSMSVGGEDGKTPSISTSTTMTMFRMINEWNLTDDQGRRAELNLRNVGELPMTYMNPIMEAIDEINKRGQVVNPLPSSNGAPALTLMSSK